MTVSLSRKRFLEQFQLGQCALDRLLSCFGSQAETLGSHQR
jgi:hypothetical protein